MMMRLARLFGDTIIVAIGQSTDLTHIKEQGVPLTRVGGLEADG
jgi:hypothetical protein